MSRAVSVLSVAEPSLWTVLSAVLDLDAHSVPTDDPLQRIVHPSFERLLPTLREAGVPVLVRYATRTAAQIEASRADLHHRVEALSERARAVLHQAQRHARHGLVSGQHVWDPREDAAAVRALHGAELITALPDEAEPLHGSYQLHPDLPAPPPFPYDLSEAVMPRPSDLPAPGPGTVDLLHDIASLAAALSHHQPQLTHAGTPDKATVRKLGRRLASPAVASSGDLNTDPRWSRALQALQALSAVAIDPNDRRLRLEPGLDLTLEGTTAEAVDRMLHLLVDHDLQAALPAVRAALDQAGDGALDEVIFLDELALQHREIVFARWHRAGGWVYPNARGDTWLPFDRDHFDLVEAPLLRALLRTLSRVGLIVRHDGVFAATPDGQLWARGANPHAPPVWISSDLEVMVPPRAVTPWERYQLERLSRCLSRDVVDRYTLERAGLETWLATHDVHDALDLLRRRCPTVPSTVTATITSWAASATRFVLTRGVVLA
jgi:hypothetical protein